jgi:NADH:ubiquinone oxidoreductase subunit 2 (subunit N)
MYMGDRIADNKPLALSPALQTALIVSVIGVLAVGVYPQPLVKLAQDLIGPLASAAAIALK